MENNDIIVINCIHLNVMIISGYVHGFPVEFHHVDVDFAQCLPTDHPYDAIKIVWKKFGNMLHVHMYIPKI
jgi:hypothetical protein